MVKTHAYTISANVVDFMPLCDRAMSLLIEPTMSCNIAAGIIGSTPDLKHTVPVGVDKSGPKPAGVRLVDLAPEPVHGWNAFLERSSSRHINHHPGGYSFWHLSQAYSRSGMGTAEADHPRPSVEKNGPFPQPNHWCHQRMNIGTSINGVFPL